MGKRPGDFLLTCRSVVAWEGRRVELKCYASGAVQYSAVKCSDIRYSLV